MRSFAVILRCEGDQRVDVDHVVCELLAQYPGSSIVSHDAHDHLKQNTLKAIEDIERRKTLKRKDLILADLNRTLANNVSRGPGKVIAVTVGHNSIEGEVYERYIRIRGTLDKGAAIHHGQHFKEYLESLMSGDVLLLDDQTPKEEINQFVKRHHSR